MNRYDLKRSRFLILISFIITFTVLYLLAYIKGIEILAINSNDYLTEKAREYVLTVENQKQLEIMKKAIRKMDTVIIRNNNDMTISYFRENAEYGPSIKVTGQKEDKSNYPILLGRNLYRGFLESKKDKYELVLKNTTILCDVAGILESGRYDFKDFSSYLLIDFNSRNPYDFSGTWRVEGKQDVFKGYLEEGGIDYRVGKIRSLTLSGSQFISVESIFMGMLLSLFIFTMVLLVRLWFLNYMKEAGIRISFGGSKSRIYRYVLQRYIIANILGIVGGIVIFAAYYRIFLTELGYEYLISPAAACIGTILTISIISGILTIASFNRRSIRMMVDI